MYTIRGCFILDGISVAHINSNVCLLLETFTLIFVVIHLLATLAINITSYIVQWLRAIFWPSRSLFDKSAKFGI